MEENTTREKVFEDGTRWVYVYDSTGKQIERVSYDEHGDLAETALYSYDERGNRIRCVINRTKGGDSLLEYEYSEDNKLLVRRESSFNNKRVRVYKYEHDRPDGKIKQTVFDKDGALIAESLEDFI